MKTLLIILFYFGSFFLFFWLWKKIFPKSFEHQERLFNENYLLKKGQKLSEKTKIGAIIITTFLVSVIWCNSSDNVLMMLGKFLIVLFISVLFWVWI